MSNFKGNKGITLQPNDRNVTYSFLFPSNSSATSNDGYLPWGTVISTVVVTAMTKEEVDATAMIVDTTNSANVVYVNMDYPTASMVGVPGTGRFTLTFVLTLDNGTILEADFTRVSAKDIK